MTKARTLVALDVGEARIGVAVADDLIRIAMPFDTIVVDGNELVTLGKIILAEKADTIVVGYPRNQSGSPTAQTRFVEEFVGRLMDYMESFDTVPDVEYQDESLTSVMAEDRLKSRGKPYAKGDIDKEAAVIILQDYLEGIAS